MRKCSAYALAVFAAAAFPAGAARAQFKNGSQPTALTIPRVSQRAQVTQRVGLTDISITYSVPMVGGREIWGTVVPYGKVWRAGANENTTILFTDYGTDEEKPSAPTRHSLHISR